MSTPMEAVDADMQIIPRGSRSGRHRHLAEECLYVLEGQRYDLHQDCDVEITDTYDWTPQTKVKRSVINRHPQDCGLNDLEQIGNAPEYDPVVALDGEIVGGYLRGRIAAVR